MSAPRLLPGVRVVMCDGAVGAVVALAAPTFGDGGRDNDVVIKLLTGETVRVGPDQIKQVVNNQPAA